MGGDGGEEVTDYLSGVQEVSQHNQVGRSYISLSVTPTSGLPTFLSTT